MLDKTDWIALVVMVPLLAFVGYGCGGVQGGVCGGLTAGIGVVFRFGSLWSF